MWWWFSKAKERKPDSDLERPAADADAFSYDPVRVVRLRRDAGNEAPRTLAGDARQTRYELDAPQQSEVGDDRDLIRIHTDENAARLADELGAAAYARGRDIYFGAGKYAPDTQESQRLLAHEIAHALQAEPGSESTRPVSAADVVGTNDVSERDAESFARGAASDRSASVHGQSSGSDSTAIHRAPLQEGEVVQKLHSALRGGSPDGRAVVTMLALLDREPGRIDAMKSAYAAAYGTEIEIDVRAALDGELLVQVLRLLHVVGLEPPPLLRRLRSDG